MRYEIEDPRLNELLKFVAASARIQDLDSLLCLLSQQAQGLIEFQRLSILLYNPNREVLKTIVIGDQAACEAVEMCMPMFRPEA